METPLTQLTLAQIGNDDNEVLFFPIAVLTIPTSPSHAWTPQAKEFAKSCMYLIPPEQQKTIIGTATDSPLRDVCNLIADVASPGSSIQITPLIVKKALVEISKSCGMKTFLSGVLDGLPESTNNRAALKQHIRNSGRPCRDAATNTPSNPCQ